MKSLFVFVLALAGMFSLVPSALHGQDAPLGDLISNHPETIALTTAMKSADLLAGLNEENDLVLLAPSDKAFAGLPPGLVDALLRPENVGALRTLLRYHVVSVADDGSFDLSDRIGKGDSLGTPVSATNGRLYIIDHVMVPPGLNLKALMDNE